MLVSTSQPLWTDMGGARPMENIFSLSLSPQLEIPLQPSVFTLPPETMQKALNTFAQI